MSPIKATLLIIDELFPDDYWDKIKAIHSSTRHESNVSGMRGHKIITINVLVEIKDEN